MPPPAASSSTCATRFANARARGAGQPGVRPHRQHAGRLASCSVPSRSMAALSRALRIEVAYGAGAAPGRVRDARACRRQHAAPTRCRPAAWLEAQGRPGRACAAASGAARCDRADAAARRRPRRAVPRADGRSEGGAAPALQGRSAAKENARRGPGVLVDGVSTAEPITSSALPSSSRRPWRPASASAFSAFFAAGAAEAAAAAGLASAFFFSFAASAAKPAVAKAAAIRAARSLFMEIPFERLMSAPPVPR